MISLSGLWVVVQAVSSTSKLDEQVFGLGFLRDKSPIA